MAAALFYFLAGNNWILRCFASATMVPAVSGVANVIGDETVETSFMVGWRQ